jgi:hypothetical protein
MPKKVIESIKFGCNLDGIVGRYVLMITYWTHNKAFQPTANARTEFCRYAMIFYEKEIHLRGKRIYGKNGGRNCILSLFIIF